MSPVKSRREQYSEATKAALLEAATRRFAERGYAGTALEDVAADTRVTRGAVYHHFASKIALFQAVFDGLEGDTVRLVTAAVEAAGDDPWAMVRAALGSFLDRCCDPVYGRVVWQEAPIALGWERWKECEEEYAYGQIEQLVHAVADASDVVTLPLEPLARITFHILGAAGMALAEAAEQDKPRVRDEYERVIWHLLTSVRV
ncbi:TetR/AcrR family transcriptional regulator [Thermomonospora umbrina]|uniref:TetR family transcriptional regulator n=1 Tax=Thermomonospora umbrina TaxID=111806 RepID=A0A3D9SW83_9ACTN|nr:TetR/AcrR family transcriptional regulator [Thermomonospora umbrina]REE99857.1 TetR family transcriptional regulator [Thermomonospora umbrina]